MKTLKSFLASLIVLVIAVYAGCNDQVTSSPDSDVSTYNKGHKPEVDKQTGIPVFHTQIRLKPNRSYTFNYSNTGLIKFTSINIQNLYPGASAGLADQSCKDIKIYNKYNHDKKGYVELNCQSNKLDLKEITVENTSSSFLDLDVILFGQKRIPVPVQE